MKKSLILLVSTIYFIGLQAQQISVHPINSVDSVWYTNVDWNSKPDPLSCMANQVGYFRYEYMHSTLVKEDALKDTTYTEKEDWTEDEELIRGAEVNSKYKSRLADKLNTYDESREDLQDLCVKEIEDFIDNKWTSGSYQVCEWDCWYLTAECYTFWEVVQIGDPKVEYRYVTSFSWSEEVNDSTYLIETDYDLKIFYSGWIYFKVGCKCLEDDFVDESLQIPSPWDHISMTGERMKPAFAATVSFEKSGIPLWIPITGGVITGGVITYIILIDDNDEPDPDPDPEPLVVTGEVISIPCGMPQTINVLANDSGEGIQLIEASTTNGEVQIINNSQIQITALFEEQVQITYVVQDDNGNTAEGVVDITVNFPIIEAIDDSYSTDFQTSIEGNILENDNGEQLSVIGNTQTTSGQLTVLPDGSFTYTPNTGFSGQDQFQYTIIDKCGQQTLAIVAINVKEQLCDYEISVETTPADCGIGNGIVMVTVTPDGNYEYKWSDDGNGAQRSDLKEGFYTVEVLGDEGCSKSIDVEVSARPPDYNISISTEPGNCEGGGEIVLITETAGQGPMVIVVNGPNDSLIIEAPPEQDIHLSDYLNILPGNYGIVVYDKGAGVGCSEIILSEIVDNTPELIAINDSFNTSFRTAVDGNVLVNDQGLSNTLVDVNDIIGGAVKFSENGQFTFTPDNDFSGEASFVYTISDACGNVTTALVIIFVKAAECEFTAEFEVTNASCGSSDGAASIAIEPQGEYSYTWSDGTTEATLINVEEGTYSVTVVDNDLNCSLEFMVEIDEEAADFVQDTLIIQSVCGGEGDIVLDLQSNAGPPYFLNVTHPGGSDQLFVDNEGQFSLSNEIEVIPGDYIIDVRNLNLPAYCQQRIQATIEPSFAPMIVIEGVIPPSSPSANDGSIILFIEQQTNAPYQVFVNGVLYDITSSEVITINELAAGFYEIFILDASGCMSNTVSVELEPDGLVNFEYLSSPLPQPPSDLFMDQTIEQQEMLPGQMMGVHWAFKRYSLTPFVILQIGSANYSGLINVDIFSVLSGFEQTISWRGLQFTPRMGINTQFNHWTSNHLEQTQLQFSPVFQTDLSMPISGSMQIFNRSSLRGSPHLDWNLEIGIRMR